MTLIYTYNEQGGNNHNLLTQLKTTTYTCDSPNMLYLYPVRQPLQGLLPVVPCSYRVSTTYSSCNIGTIYNMQTNKYNSATVQQYTTALLILDRNVNLLILAVIYHHKQHTQMGDKLNSAPWLSPQAARTASVLLDIHFTSPLNLCKSSGGKETVLSQGVIWCFDDGAG